MISFVNIFPSKGKTQDKKLAILSGLRIVVEKERGFRSGIFAVIICYEHLLWVGFYAVIVKTYIIAAYVIYFILLWPLRESPVEKSFVVYKIRNAESNIVFIEFIEERT